MVILHYILGFPPHRTGGLTSYALDLIYAEKCLGHKVYSIFPGNFDLINTNVSRIKKCHNTNDVYMLTNSLPISLMYGIGNPSTFMKQREILGFDDFINEVKPEVFHVHTLMGLPIELLVLVKKAGIRIVFTTHDYFGLCPRVNFINSIEEVCCQPSAENCQKCCNESPCKLFLKIRNSRFIVPIKKVLR